MENDYFIQQIGIVKNEMTHIWNALIVVIGGTIGLLFVTQSIKTFALFLFGIFFTILLVNAYVTRRINLLTLLNQLNKEKSWKV
jgi:hypothetical protein